MDINQIYTIVNSVTSQAMGSSALTVVDEQGLVSLGNEVLSSSTNIENWTGTLLQLIGRQIISFRRYNPSYKRLLRDDMQWGAVLQKIKVDMPDAVNDDAYDIEDGASIDPYVVSKPKVHQKLFVTETPYMFKITIHKVTLEEAFKGASSMGSFISAQFGEVQNAIDLSLESLAMNCVNNFIAETNGTTRAIPLVTNYNAIKGTSLTAANAMYDESFLRYAIASIKNYSDRMVRMNKGVYNDGTTSRHTPKQFQNLYIASEFERNIETQVQYGAFHDSFVQLEGYETVPYWQSLQTPLDVDVQRASDGTETQVSNVVCCLFDIEACGIYKKDFWSGTTPFNPRGGYTNYFYHMKELYFNDTSENFICFTLN